jgi:3-mercaptopyruvate sulfurtransferase SseA
MRPDKQAPLVSTEWLARHLNDPKLRVVDVRWRYQFP